LDRGVSGIDGRTRASAAARAAARRSAAGRRPAAARRRRATRRSAARSSAVARARIGTARGARDEDRDDERPPDALHSALASAFFFFSGAPSAGFSFFFV